MTRAILIGAIVGLVVMLTSGCELITPAIAALTTPATTPAGRVSLITVETTKTANVWNTTYRCQCKQ